MSGTTHVEITRGDTTVVEVRDVVHASTYVPVAGASAYEVAVLAGFEGTAEEWLASLRGDPGDPTELLPLAIGDVDGLADALADRVTAGVLAALLDPPWTALDFTEGTGGKYSSQALDPAFYRIRLGRLEFKGSVAVGVGGVAANDTIARLPSGSRPTFLRRFGLATNAAVFNCGLAASGQLQVYSTNAAVTTINLSPLTIMI